MQCILFIGLQASGKSTFYRERFFSTHVRINLDMLKTRHREQRLLASCLETQQPFVVDNTNPTRAERRVYIEAARPRLFRVVGYYFQSRLEDCARRNAERAGEHQVPLKGLLGTGGRLELPSRDEGFDELYYVRITEDGSFTVEEWRDEV
jgi:predicted kinase